MLPLTNIMGHTNTSDIPRYFVHDERTLGWQEQAEKKNPGEIFQIIDLSLMICFWQVPVFWQVPAQPQRCDLNLSDHSDKSVGSFFVQDGSSTIGSSSEQLACIKQHAETQLHVLQFFHLQSKKFTYLLVDTFCWCINEEWKWKKAGVRQGVLFGCAVAFACQILSVWYVIVGSWKVQDASMGPTPTSPATRLQALRLFLHIGAVKVLRSKTNLIEALTND